MVGLEFYQVLAGIARVPLRESSLLLHEPATALAFSLALVIAASLAFREWKALPYMASAVALALVLGFAFQLLIQEARPCATVPGRIPCPPGFSLPSIHSLLAFTLAISALGNRSFPLYLAFAAFVAFSRVYLGVHAPAEAFAGLALAFFACVATEMLWKAAGWRVPNEIHIKHDLGKLAP